MQPLTIGNITVSTPTLPEPREKLFHSFYGKAEKLLREHELRVLLSLSEAIARVRDRDELLSFIVEQVRPLFGFNEYTVIYMLSPDTQQMKMFFRRMSDNSWKQSRIADFEEFPVEGIFHDIVHSREVVVTNEDWKWTKKSSQIDEAAAQVWRDLDFRQALSVRLKIFDRVIGTFHVHFYQPQEITAEKLHLFQAVSEQIGVAMANILANEDVQRKAREIEVLNQQLLDINNAVTPFQSRERIMGIMTRQLQKVVAFDGCYISLWTPGNYGLAFLLDQILPSMRNHPEVVALQTRPLMPFVLAQDRYFTKTEEIPDADEINNQPICVYDYDLLAESDFQRYPILRLAKEKGVKEVLCVPLIINRQRVATLVLQSLIKGRFANVNLPLIKKMAEAIAIGVSNVLLYEDMRQAKDDLEQREREKTLQVELNDALTGTNDSKAAFLALAKLFGRVFDYSAFSIRYDDDAMISSSCVFRKNASGEVEYWDYLADSLPKFGITKEEYFRQALEMIDHFNTDGIMTGAPHDALCEKFSFARLHREHFGIRSSMNLSAKIRNRNSSVHFYFTSDKPAGFSQSDYQLLQKLTPSAAIAVENLLAFEDIEMREREKSILLDITTAIASIKNRQELLRIIFAKLSPIFPFNESVNVFVFEPGLKEYRFFFNNAEQSQRSYEIIDSLYYQQFPVDEVVTYVISDEHPKWMLTDEWSERMPGHWAWTLMKQLGLGLAVSAPLIVRGEIIGLFNLNFTSPDALPKRMLPLYKAISDQLAVAIANILADEEIARREREKSLQIAVIEALTTHDTWEARFAQVAKVFRPVFDWNILSFRHQVPGTVRNINFIQEEGRVRLLSPIEDILLSDTVEDVMTAGEKNRNQPQVYNGPAFEAAALNCKWMEVARERFKLRSSLTVSLGAGPARTLVRVVAGSRHENAFTPAHVELLEKLSGPLSLAMEKLMVQEEVEQREREKSMLLAFAQELSAIRHKQDLLKTVRAQLKHFVQFDDALIALTNADRQTHSVFLVDGERGRAQHPDFAKTAALDYPVRDGVYNKVIEAARPQRFDVVDAAAKNPKAGYLRFVAAAGIREMLSAPLRHRNECIGVLCLQAEHTGVFRESDFPLLQAIADQVAVAVANIRANEEARERETEKEIQLCIINHINASVPWEQRFERIASELQRHVPFQFAYFSFGGESPNYGYGFLRTGRNEYQYVNKQHFLRIAHLDETRFLQSVLPAARKGRRVANEDEYRELSATHPVLRAIGEGMGMKSNLAYTQTLTHYGTFFISLFHTEGNTYRPKQLSLLESIFAGITATIEKNLHADEIARLKEKLEHEKIYLSDEIKSTYNFDEIIGTSKDMQEVYKKVSQVAKTDVTVLITGETGTGKELIARAIHNYSDRKKNVMVKVNCAVLPPQLIESELFGHERGAFTGAIDRRLGKFEIANNSTIFLDEIGELPLDLQAKLLRVLQEKEFERLGSNKVIRTDIRVVAATNRNLEKEVAEGRFRSDLYYRLSVFPIELPPLRERKEDIPLLAAHFIDKYSRKFSKAVTGTSNEVMQELLSSKWAGNIRELEHVLERAVMLAPAKMITSLHQSKKLHLHNQFVFSQDNIVPKTWAQNEKDHILNILKITNGRIRGAGGAAELLDIKPTTLEARMRKLGIEKKFG